MSSESSTRAEALTGRHVNAPRREAVRSFVDEHVWSLAVWVVTIGWSALLFAISRNAYLSFREGRFDLGNMVQAVWSTVHGHPLEMTDGSTGEQVVRLGTHVDPFLVLLAPLWVVWPSPLALILAQIVVVSLGALPVFWLARLHLGSERLAGVLALAYLAYPWVATSAVGAIHPVTFAITFLLFCVWSLEVGRLWVFAFFAALTMSTGELMGLPIAGLGVWYALARGRRAVGAAMVLAGAVWTFVAVSVIVPAVRGGESVYYGFYEGVGGSPQGVVRTLFTDPGAVVGALFESQDIAYVVWLGLPLLFLFLLSPGLAAVAIPQLLANGLSGFRSMTDPRYHSVAAIIPFLVAATALGIRKIPELRRGMAAAAVLVCSATLALVVGPWPRAVGMTPLGGRDMPEPERVAALREAVSLVPRDAAVAASNGPGGHLSGRRYIYSLPNVERAEWVVVDLAEPWIVTRKSPILTSRPEVIRALAARLSADSRWATVFERDGVFVFRRAEG